MESNSHIRTVVDLANYRGVKTIALHINTVSAHLLPNKRSKLNPDIQHATKLIFPEQQEQFYHYQMKNVIP